MAANARDARLHADSSPAGGRTAAQRDRDRILHTFALRRLADVTQVVGAHEGQLFHNRLTHSLEVAQVARRLAERLVREQPVLARRLGPIDPDVCEAAALAHDLGHPPFGHIAEQTLDEEGRALGLDDAFEGNAQSLRIVTRLAAHRPEYRGLNLCRATLAAVLKYPWRRAPMNAEPKRHRKFGAYDEDIEALDFARAGATLPEKTAEASIMNMADDIAYSVHDFDDFSRAGLIPTQVLRPDRLGERLERWKRRQPEISITIDAQRPALENLLELLRTSDPYEGTFQHRAHFRQRAAYLIDAFVTAVQLTPPDPEGQVLHIREEHRIQIEFLKRLVFEFVIERPGLGAQQEGQRRIIRELLSTYRQAIERRDVALVPAIARDELLELGPRRTTPSLTGHRREVRLAIDIVASFTESQAVAMFKRITGQHAGSVADFMAR